MTNGDRIREMSDIDLAREFAIYFGCGGCPAKEQGCGCSFRTCRDAFKKWLKKKGERE